MERLYIRASSLTGIHSVAEEVGRDLRAVMRSVGLGTDLLRKPEERIQFSAHCALLEKCAEEWELPDLGLRVAPYQHLEVLGPVGLVTRMERDLRDAVTAVANNLVIHSNALTVVPEERGDVASVILDVQPVPAGTRQYTLLAVGVTRNILEQAGKARIDFLEVTFRHNMGGARRAVERYFGCPVRFGAERNALYFDRATLDRPIETSDTAFHSIIQKYLTSARRDISGRTSDSVRDVIARQMELGSCTLESAARSLRIEPRSLQRRLKQEGLAFRDLIDEWRRGRALTLITHTRLPLSEVSLAVGYSDQSIFSRAFQRWYGDTPLAYRNKDAALAAAS